MLFSSKICPCCSGTQWLPFIDIKTGCAMTSDQRIVQHNINKIECVQCGVVTNKDTLSHETLADIYGRQYQLNTNGEEHFFFTKAGAVARSQVYFDWLVPHIPEGYTRLLEVGCGQGNLLKRLQEHKTTSEVIGIDGSELACQLARDKGLDVRQSLLLDESDTLPEADVIVSVGVLEHMEDPALLLQKARKALPPNGIAIFCLPIQDYPGYDLFFVDHIWHFTVSQCINMIQKNNFRIIHVDSEHDINYGFGLFVCQKVDGLIFDNAEIDRSYIKKNRDHWLSVLGKINQWLEDNKEKRLAAFGASEVFSFLMAYTNLSQGRIKACIDEDPRRIGNSKHDIPIHSPDWLSQKIVDTVMLTINPKYHFAVSKKLAKYGVEVISFIGSGG